MAKSDLPRDPNTSKFGWPQPSRIEEFKKLHAAPAKATERVVFQGKTVDLPVIVVPITLPKYRMANGRTASLQAEYLATHTSIRKDLFSGDAEMWDAQELQHQLLLKLAKQGDLRKHFEDTSNKQVDPILVDESGFVVNGNRRLATWRDLTYTDSPKYPHFQHIEIAVLPHCEEKEIDRLEATLQIEKDIKADYSWDAQANMMLLKQKRFLYSNKDLADLYKMKIGDVEELFDMRSYAEEYLRSRGFDNQWSRVADHEFAFRKIVSSRQKISGMGNQEVFKQAAFVLMEKPEDAGGRLYEVIPALVESLEPVKAKLRAELTVEVAAPDVALVDLFGGAPQNAADSADLPLAKAIQKAENADQARKILVDVIESQRQLKKDSKAAGYLLDCCARAQAALAAAVKEGLRVESKLEGVEKQLEQIEKQIGQIRKFVQQNAKH